MIGKSLGPYAIKESLGAGGMGEVYLAEDTRLGRKVAIKVLPAQFAADPERLARFEQEARAAAALNHPHIAAVFDVGEAAADDGDAAGAEPIHFIVQEYLEGRTLRQALEKGPMPLHRALALAAEVGEALDAAHAAGIVHRDLKPDNVFITESGHAKVLDFGLAKLTELAGGGAQISMSPTALGTVAGQVMGTAGYMSPEQVNGEEVDARADVFAFGCVLYEMVTGRRAFGGETVVDTLHAVLRTEPVRIDEVRADLPAELRRIQAKCMAKDRARRYQHVADLVVDLNALRIEVEAGAAGRDGAVVGSATGAVEPAATADAGVATSFAAAATGGRLPGASSEVRDTSDSRAAAATGAGLTGSGRWLVPALATWALLATASVVYLSLPASIPEAPVARFAEPLDITAVFSGSSTLAISPDGRKVVYPGSGPDGAHLRVRYLDTLEARALPGTVNADSPFFAADSRTLVFISLNQLRIIDVDAGTTSDLLLAIRPDSIRGGTFAPDGSVVVGGVDSQVGDFSTNGLRRLDRSSGELVSLTAVENAGESHRYPQFLPDGRILFTRETTLTSTRSDKEIAVASPDGAEITVLDVRGTQARYLPTGHLAFVRGQTLVAAPFDLDSLRFSGPEVVVVRDLAGDADVGNAQYAIADNGTLVYETASGGDTRLAFVDRTGRFELLHSDPRAQVFPRISPDGRRILVSIDDGQSDDIWSFEIGRGTFDPFTRLGGAMHAEWSPDGSRVAFQSNHHGGNWSIFLLPGDGLGEPERINIDPLGLYSSAVWQPSGETMMYGVIPGDLLSVSLDGATQTPFITSDFIEGMPAFSPDGKWVAYASNEQSRYQIYVTAYPGPGRRMVASTAGGAEPKWSRDGTELYYRNGPDMMVVSFDPEADPPLGSPERLFTLNAAPGTWTIPNYDVTADGRFVMLIGDQGAEPAKLVTVLNWFEELRRLAPTPGR